jgi:copper chaperone
MTNNTHGIEHLGSRTRMIVENIKCGGCANTITKAMNELDLKEVTIDTEKGSVEINNPNDQVKLAQAIEKLKDLGYPLVESEAGLKAIALKAKSYVSCAFGKIK